MQMALHSALRDRMIILTSVSDILPYRVDDAPDLR